MASNTLKGALAIINSTRPAAKPVEPDAKPIVGKALEVGGDRWRPIAPGTTFEPGTYEDGYSPRGQVDAPSDVRRANLGQLGGEFFQSPTVKGSVIRSEDKIPYSTKKEYRQGLPTALAEVEHVYPRWAGGTSEKGNIQILPKFEHAKKTAVDHVMRTLYRNPELTKKLLGRKIEKNDAVNMVMNYQGLNVDDLLGKDAIFLDKNFTDKAVKLAVKKYKEWSKPVESAHIGPIAIPSSWKEFKSLFKADTLSPISEARGIKTNIIKKGGDIASQKVASIMPDTAFGEFGKGFTSGITLGWVPYEPEGYEKSAAMKVSQGAGAIVGGLAGMIAAMYATRGAFGMGKAALSASLAKSGIPGISGWASRLAAANKFSLGAVPKPISTTTPLVTAASKALQAVGEKGIPIVSSLAAKVGNVGKVGKFAKNLKELTPTLTVIGQMNRFDGDAEEVIKQRANRLAADLGFSVVGAAFPLGGFKLKNIAPVWMGTGLVDVAAGSTWQEALTDATVSTLFQGIAGPKSMDILKQASAETRNIRSRVLGSQASDLNSPNLTQQQRLERLEMETADGFGLIDRDGTITASQKKDAKIEFLLAQKLAYAETLPPKERAKYMEEQAKSAMRYAMRNGQSDPASGHGALVAAAEADPTVSVKGSASSESVPIDVGSRGQSSVRRAAEKGILVPDESGTGMGLGEDAHAFSVTSELPDGNVQKELVVGKPGEAPVVIGRVSSLDQTGVDFANRMDEANVKSVEAVSVKVDVDPGTGSVMVKAEFAPESFAKAADLQARADVESQAAAVRSSRRKTEALPTVADDLDGASKVLTEQNVEKLKELRGELEDGLWFTGDPKDRVPKFESIYEGILGVKPSADTLSKAAAGKAIRVKDVVGDFGVEFAKKKLPKDVGDIVVYDPIGRVPAKKKPRSIVESGVRTIDVEQTPDVITDINLANDARRAAAVKRVAARAAAKQLWTDDKIMDVIESPAVQLGRVDDQMILASTDEMLFSISDKTSRQIAEIGSGYDDEFKKIRRSLVSQNKRVFRELQARLMELNDRAELGEADAIQQAAVMAQRVGKLTGDHAAAMNVDFYAQMVDSPELLAEADRVANSRGMSHADALDLVTRRKSIKRMAALAQQNKAAAKKHAVKAEPKSKTEKFEEGPVTVTQGTPNQAIVETVDALPRYGDDGLLMSDFLSENGFAEEAAIRNNPKGLVTFDVESQSGRLPNGKLDVENSKIVQLSAVKEMPDGTKETFNRYVTIDEPVNDWLQNNTQITDDLLKSEGVGLEKAMADFRAFVGDASMQGYNVFFFDLPVVNKALKTYGLPTLNEKNVIDVAALYRAILSGWRKGAGETHSQFARNVLDYDKNQQVKWNLTKASEEYGISLEQAHDSLYDATATAKLAPLVVDRISKMKVATPETVRADMVAKSGDPLEAAKRSVRLAIEETPPPNDKGYGAAEQAFLERGMGEAETAVRGAAVPIFDDGRKAAVNAKQLTKQQEDELRNFTRDRAEEAAILEKTTSGKLQPTDTGVETFGTESPSMEKRLDDAIDSGWIDADKRERLMMTINKSAAQNDPRIIERSNDLRYAVSDEALDARAAWKSFREKPLAEWPGATEGEKLRARRRDFQEFMRYAVDGETRGIGLKQREFDRTLSEANLEKRASSDGEVMETPAEAVALEEAQAEKLAEPIFDPAEKGSQRGSLLGVRPKDGRKGVGAVFEASAKAAEAKGQAALAKTYRRITEKVNEELEKYGISDDTPVPQKALDVLNQQARRYTQDEKNAIAMVMGGQLKNKSLRADPFLAKVQDALNDRADEYVRVTFSPHGEALGGRYVNAVDVIVGLKTADMPIGQALYAEAKTPADRLALEQFFRSGLKSEEVLPKRLREEYRTLRQSDEELSDRLAATRDVSQTGKVVRQGETSEVADLNRSLEDINAKGENRDESLGVGLYEPRQESTYYELAFSPFTNPLVRDAVGKLPEAQQAKVADRIARRISSILVPNVVVSVESAEDALKRSIKMTKDAEMLGQEKLKSLTKLIDDKISLNREYEKYSALALDDHKTYFPRAEAAKAALEKTDREIYNSKWIRLEGNKWHKLLDGPTQDAVDQRRQTLEKIESEKEAVAAALAELKKQRGGGVGEVRKAIVARVEQLKRLEATSKNLAAELNVLEKGIGMYQAEPRLDASSGIQEVTALLRDLPAGDPQIPSLTNRYHRLVGKEFAGIGEKLGDARLTGLLNRLTVLIEEKPDDSYQYRRGVIARKEDLAQILRKSHLGQSAAKEEISKILKARAALTSPEDRNYAKTLSQIVGKLKGKKTLDEAANRLYGTGRTAKP